MAQDRKPWRDQVAEEMIRQIEAGTAPWQKPWKPGIVGGTPFNPVSNRSYRGINRLWLDMQGHEDPRWLTYDQAASLGAQVRKGERGTTIEYWKWTERQPVVDEAGRPVLDAAGQQQYRETELQRPKVFYARVFNAEQIDGLEPYKAPELDFSRATRLGEIFRDLSKVEALPNGDQRVTGLGLVYDQEDRAFYDPVRDEIHMPPPHLFKGYYEHDATALHELGHATGHKSRMDRQFGPFGSEAYAREELRAEMASYIACRALGLGHYPERHASYLASWVKILKEDKNALFQAARDADRIATWILEPGKRLELEQEMRAQRRGAVMDKANDSQQQAADQSHRKPKIWLNVPFADKDQAKAAGARWDRQHKSWFVREGDDLSAVSRWRTGAAPAEAGAADPAKEFAAALQQHGIVIKGAPVMDGMWHRAALEDDKPGAKSASYRAFLDGRPNGQIRNFKTGQTHQWVSGGELPSPEELSKLKAQAEETRKRRQQEIEARHRDVAMEANRLWAEARLTAGTPANRGYLGGKQVGAYDIRFSPELPIIYVPMRDIDGKLHNIQTIDEDSGTKSFMKGGRMQGLMHVIDPDKRLGQGPFIVSEGYSTGATLHQLSGLPVVIAFNAGNLEAVAKALREKYPSAQMFIAADDDHKLENKPSGNVGLNKAREAAAAVDGQLLVPPLTPEEKAKGLTDWNDLSCARGEKAVSDLLERQISRGQAQSMARGIAHRETGFLGRAVSKVREGIGL